MAKHLQKYINMLEMNMPRLIKARFGHTDDN